MEKDLLILLSKIKQYYPHDTGELVKQAYEFAKAAHEGQQRENGDPYLTHVYATALYLAEWKMPAELVTAGLLHDVPEDTHYTIKDLEQRFGKEIASIVEGETKISKLRYQGTQRYAENLRKMFLAMAQDVRVVIVKFADRMHNLKTIESLPPHRIHRTAQETLDIYAPIANRLGMGAIKGDLEDLAFQYANPKEYERIIGLIAEPIHEREQYLEKIITRVKKVATENHIKPISIHGRAKRLYSLYKKLLERDNDIGKIYDLVALRVIVSTIPECYTVLGMIHQIWRPLKGRIKDYIAQPKPNGYQSLHTTVFGDDGEIIEIQVRTQEMHEEAEYGIAAHWFYADQGKQSKKLDGHTKWLKELVKIQKGVQDHNQLLKTLESLKIEFFNNRIFVFTPKGDVIDLPEGATPIDLAYAIHTMVGNQCVGVRVNEEMAPLSKPLLSGDIVEIIRDKKRKGPSADWLKFAKTTHAREKIKDHLKNNRLLGWFGDIGKKVTFRSR